MNQYIINETMLQTWRKGCLNPKIPHTDDDTCKKCKYRGKGLRKNCCDFDDNAMEDLFRSHPYQSERDTYKKLAELFFEWLDNIDTASDIAKGDDKLYRSFVSQEHKKRFEYANPDGSLKELRQAGEP